MRGCERQNSRGSQLACQHGSAPKARAYPIIKAPVITRPRCQGMIARRARRSRPAAACSHDDAKGVVITGGSKGFGLAMAREFLQRGDAVVLCGRSEGRLAAAVDALRGEWPGTEVHGLRADVSSSPDMAALGAFAQRRLGTLDLWINNAGEVTRKTLLADVDAEEVLRVVGSNVAGSLLGCREAVRLMRAQPQRPRPAYHIFNLGFSRWGASLSKSAATHKATKAALTQLTRSLAEELQEAGVTSVGVHNLSPGMVLTDLLLRDAAPAARRFFNALAEEPETVAAALAPRVRAVQGTGQSIEYLSPMSSVGRVLLRAPQILNGGRFFDREGLRVRAGDAEYQDNGVRLPYGKWREQGVTDVLPS